LQRNAFARQVADEIACGTTPFRNLTINKKIALQDARKVDGVLLFATSREIGCSLQRVFCNLLRNVFAIIALQLAGKIAFCDSA